MIEESLYDAIRKGGYDSSLITTYNAYFPFYEGVVLRKLRASGCRHNVLLADAKQCAAAALDAFSAPRRAGREYTLVPMRSVGAFHPKIVLMFGRSKGLLCVGSHNLTLAGFGYNRELTNVFEFDPKKDADAVSCVRMVWKAVKEWLNAQTHLPLATVEAVSSLRNHAPWLEGDHTVDPDPVFLAQSTTSGSLWDQLGAHAPRSVRSIVVVGAFFDSKLELLNLLTARWPQAQLVCGIEPDTVSLPANRASRSNFDFRDASKITERSGYLHAKAIFFEGRDGDHLLASGSANPSAPAWLGVNEEAIILRKGVRALKAAEALGLLEIKGFKSLRREQWDVISTDLPQEAKTQKVLSAILVSESDVGFEVPKAAFDRMPVRCTAETASGSSFDLQLPAHSSGHVLVIPTESSIRRDTRMLLFELKGGDTVGAIVHHTAEIEDLARSTKQAQFREALQGLSRGSADLAKLISAVEKVIFDDEGAISTAISTRRRVESGEPSSETQSNLKPDSLVVSIDDTRNGKRHRRLLKSTELGYLLDVLVHRIGIGLSTGEASVDKRGRSEEDQIGSDDDDGEPVQKNIDDCEIAKLCCRKLRKLTNRMKAQIERANVNASLTPNVLVQLVAVLAVMRELRTIEKHDRWRRAHAKLVDPDDAMDLLENVLCSFFGRGHALYDKMLDTLGSERFDEVSRLKGLLIWLAWDCGITLDKRYGIAEHREDVEERVWNKAALLELAQILSGDDVSKEETRNSILSVARADEYQAAIRWIEDCEAWGLEVEQALRRMREPVAVTLCPEEVGSLAFANAIEKPKLRVVSSVSDRSVTLFDFVEEIQYRRDRVSSAEVAIQERARRA